jgi:hypothetical protein
VPLAHSTDTTPADWLVDSDTPWGTRVSLGPAGFPAYARLRLLPDPAYEGQRESDVDVPDHVIERIPDQWRALYELLAAHTQTLDDCYFALWEGWGFDYHVRQPPKFAVTDGRLGRHPMREYFLFRGPLSDVGDWGDDFTGPGDSAPFEPAFVWPADRAWCVANDVDPHYAGIAGDTALIEQLLADPRLDAVAADLAQEPPEYG